MVDLVYYSLQSSLELILVHTFRGRRSVLLVHLHNVITYIEH